MGSLEAVVRELRWSAARSSAPRYALHAALAVAVWVTAVQVVARIVPVEQGARIAALGIPLAIVLAGAAWILARPRPMDRMRRADSNLGLKERLSTAWERRHEAGPMDAVLRQDALQHAARARLGG